jgi:predicted NBD/HSP70 family sugar kinase
MLRGATRGAGSAGMNTIGNLIGGCLIINEQVDKSFLHQILKHWMKRYEN